MKYIIMCGGRYKSWENPRHLLKIKGETIIGRTIRLLKENGIFDIYISTDNPAFEGIAPILHHQNDYMTVENLIVAGYWNEAFYPTEEPACYLFGDVVFSPEAIKTIVETQTEDVMFFGSAPPFSPLYTKIWGEPFAFKVVNQSHFQAAIQQTNVLYNLGMFKRKPIAWELWQVITGHELNDIDWSSFVNINDYTCDVDNPHDLERIERMMPYTVNMEVIG